MAGRNTLRTDVSRTQPSRGWLRRDDRRALLVCMCIGLVFLAGMGLIFSGSPTATSRRALAQQPGDDLTTGSIVFVPILGDHCRTALIDNTTWRIRDNGVTDCRTALSRSAGTPPLRWSTARVDVIRHGFARR